MAAYQAKCQHCGSGENVKTYQYSKGSKKGQREYLCAECIAKVNKRIFGSK